MILFHRLLFICILFLAYCISASASLDEIQVSIDGSANNGNPPLLMDVEWVMQGWNFGFQGFYVEFLGYLEGFRKLLPNTRIVQSSFKKSLSDPAVLNPTQFYEVDMLPREGQLAQWFEKRTPPPLDVASVIPPYSKYSPRIKLDSKELCDFPDQVAEGEAPEARDALGYSPNTLLLDGDLSRGLIEGVTDKRDCCNSCVENPLCIAWTYSSTSYTCQLKGRPSTPLVRSGHVSGTLADARGRRSPVPRAVIFHGTSCFHNNITFNRMDMNTIYIGRFMFERGHFNTGKNIDELTVFHCAAIVEEIWVPTSWHEDIMRNELQQLGFRNPQIYVIPEAVNTDLFDPELIRSRESAHSSVVIDNDKVDRRVLVASMDMEGNPITLNHAHSLDQVASAAASTTAPFVFLSIFKWEHRKGWDVLLRAYWKSFAKNDHVVLKIRSYIPSFQMTDGSDKNITNRMQQFAEREFGKTLSELARVEWVSGESPTRLSESLTRADMQSLMMSADCFVLPTRGEGWGLPIAEAMALELPVIVTDYSGIAAYATQENAYLIPVSDELDKDAFAIPNEDILAQHMKQVIVDGGYKGNGIAREKGRKARQTMKQLSPEYVVSMMTDRLRKLALRRGWEFA